MTRLLFIEASPRRDASASGAAAQDFLALLQPRCPGLEIDRLDLWQADLPAFDGAMLEAKYANLAGRPLAPNERAAWQTIAAMVTRLSRADLVLIATPMWNFGIPYRLKHWIDLVTQPGLSFTFDPASGYAPLLPPRPTLVIVASAGDYSQGPSRGRPDLATPYLQAALGFIGLSGATIIGIGPTIGAADVVAAAQAKARAKLASIAALFATDLPANGAALERMS